MALSPAGGGAKEARVLNFGVRFMNSQCYCVN